MNRVESSDDQIRQGLIALFLSFFGVAAAILVFPKMFKYLTKKYIFGFFAETVAIIFAGFFAEKLIELLSAGQSRANEEAQTQESRENAETNET